MNPVPTVTIGKPYFDTLLRLAYQTQELPRNGNDPNTITILLKQCREYENLKQSLLAGGVAPEALAILASSDDFYPTQPQAATWHDGGIRQVTSTMVLNDSHDNDMKRPFHTPALTAVVAKPFVYDAAHRFGSANADQHEPDDELASVEEPLTELHDDEQWHAQQQSQQQSQQRREPRQDHTLLFSSLPEDIKHKDLTSIIKGGRLIQIWLREKERSADVTFAEGAAAFLAYSKRNPFYIRGKRVEISWSNYQYSPHRGMLNKLATHQSRNMVIRNALNRVTIEEVIEHVDHVHQLKVVQTVWRDHDLYVSTNSITGASLARTCLLSRQQYKHIRIDWYPDECALPLPDPDMFKPRSPQKLASGVRAPAARKAMAPTLNNHNRFNLLSLNDTSSDTEPVDDYEFGSESSDIQLRPRSAASENND